MLLIFKLVLDARFDLHHGLVLRCGFLTGGNTSRRIVLINALSFWLALKLFLLNGMLSVPSIVFHRC
ncbi:hypothetical protein HYQ46_006181 [Verticillium longisporum]|nr:hypothetical protein HYQ46_006181 [Verticillium longisporum]